jgi:UDPglucose 6-dehydrogenase
MPDRPRLTVLGTGYLGMTHATCMASEGFEVLGLDTDAGKVARLAPARCRSSSRTWTSWSAMA